MGSTIKPPSPKGPRRDWNPQMPLQEGRFKGGRNCAPTEPPSVEHPAMYPMAPNADPTNAIPLGPGKPAPTKPPSYGMPFASEVVARTAISGDRPYRENTVETLMKRIEKLERMVAGMRHVELRGGVRVGFYCVWLLGALLIFLKWFGW